MCYNPAVWQQGSGRRGETVTLRTNRAACSRAVFVAAALAMTHSAPPAAQERGGPRQKIDHEYTAKIDEHLQDPRISTELVDHLPASDHVPTPLKFFNRIVGTPGELTYARDIHRYYEALDRASDRVSLWRIGRTEEGRDMVLLAVADEATLRQLDKYKAMIASLTDPRRTTAAEAQRLLETAKPIYWITSGVHSTETGGPEMLIELAYRLAVDETPFIRAIRSHVITIITPVVEVDGREKQVDTYYFNQKRRARGEQLLPLVYWGRYVAHDNNRDGIGQFLALSRAVTQTFLDWKPTILHDLHEQSTYLYASTGTGPYNEHIDPITIDEWWLLAKTDVMEMTKRGVPGVWTYGFYDGWAPNYLFFVAHTHNATGRFYEVMGYGPDNRTVTAAPAVTSREWFRANPPLPSIRWGPRNNTNIQQSALLIALNYVARNRELFVHNYWLKNARALERGKTGPVFGWVIPAGQKRKSDAAAAVNDLRRQGLELHRASSSFDAGGVAVSAGDYIIRGDQPYRTMADMYFAVQNYAPSNPRPYDDTGWTFQYMRNLVVRPLTDRRVLAQPMIPIAADVRAAGGIGGSGPVLLVDHTTDNGLVTFRFKHAEVKMEAAEESFEAGGRTFRAGTFIIPGAARAAVEPTLTALGLSAWAVESMPSVPVHDLDVPRIGYVHSWANTQDEGWVRAAFDAFGVPYTYFADTTLRQGELRRKYDVIVLPHIGGEARQRVNGILRTDASPLPYRKTAETPNLGVLDQADDIRGGMGLDGLNALVAFVRDGGTLLTEGSTSTILPEHHLTDGVAVETPPGLFVRGSVMRGVFADRRSPIAYGYDAEVPVYFNQNPVLNVGPAASTSQAAAPSAPAAIPGVGMIVAPMATANNKLSTYDPEAAQARAESGTQDSAAPASTPTGAPTASAPAAGSTAARVILAFPSEPHEMLLSGVLVGGQALANRAQLVDVPLGRGHVVSFAIRPFWRWQTHGTFFLGFNTILNWNDLDAGRGQSSVGGSQ